MAMDYLFYHSLFYNVYNMYTREHSFYKHYFIYVIIIFDTHFLLCTFQSSVYSICIIGIDMYKCTLC